MSKYTIHQSKAIDQYDAKTQLFNKGSHFFYIRPNTTDIKVIEEVIDRQTYQKKSIGFEVKPGSVWLDLGGNIGTFSIWALSKGAKKVYAYEPETENMKIFKANMELSKVSPGKVNIFNEAVGMNAGTTDLYLCKGDYNKYRHSIIPIRGRTSIKVPIISIETVLAKFPEIDSIKIDIEGAEIEILETIDLSVLQNVNQLVYEWSFDVDSSIPRFLATCNRLKAHFKNIHWTKVKETELTYTYFPRATNVYCWN
jgi:FkbM family methyltransferase